MIESRGLTNRFGGRTAVHDDSFACERGTVTGFLGRAPSCWPAPARSSGPPTCRRC